MNRRSLLKLLSMGVMGHTLDIDRLLWVPGEKTIFLPSSKLLTEKTITETILEMEMEWIIPKIRKLFQRDDMFYRILENEALAVKGRTYDD